MSEQAKQEVKVADHVIFVDSHGVARPALVTTVWTNFGGGTVPGVNVVFVSNDETRGDSYGRQIERMTSVCHKSVQPAHGNFWCWPSEL